MSPEPDSLGACTRGKAKQVVLSVVTATYNEVENISEFIERVETALKDLPFELIIVDDNSPDGTAELASKMNKKYGNIKVLRRQGKLGLGSAIRDGISEAEAELIAVIDADLQHPPELLPKMWETIRRGYDLVIASRYVKGGGVERWSFWRRLVSRGAIALAHLLLPTTRRSRDPISGYFMCRRNVIAGLHCTSFKILTEALNRGIACSVVDLPYTLKPRRKGKSKLSFREILAYVLFLLNLRIRHGRGNVLVAKVRLSTLLLIAIILVYISAFSFITILRHHYFQSYGWDFAVYLQMLYTTAFHGKLLYYTLEYAINPSNSFFGVHFSPFLFLLVPLYRLFPYAEMLLILQSAVVAFSALVVYKLALTKLSNNVVSLVLSVAYLLYTPLHVMNWVDFHLEAFIPLLVFLGYYYYVHKKYTKSLIFVILALSTFESMPVLLFPFGIYAMINGLKKKDRKLVLYASSIMLVCLVYFLIATSVMDAFNPGRHVAYHYPWIHWGATYQEVVLSWITRPTDVINYFFTVNPLPKGLYMLWLLLPLAFTPLSAPLEFVLLVFPWPTLAFLSNTLGFLVDRYAGFVAAQVFITSVEGLGKIRDRVCKNGGGKSIAVKTMLRNARTILLASILVFLFVGPLSPLPHMYGLYSGGIPVWNEHKQLLRDIIGMIPRNASVLAQNEIAPHLANRLELYSYAAPPMPSLPAKVVDYIILDLNLWPGPVELLESINRQVSGKNYSLTISADGIILFEKGAKEFKLFRPFVLVLNPNDVIACNRKIVDDAISSSGKALLNILSPSEVFWYGPYVALPPGKYVATFWLRSEREVDGYLLTLDVTADRGTRLIANRHIYGHELNPTKYTPVRLTFSLSEITTTVEFRALHVSNLTKIYLDHIEVRQMSPSSDITLGDLSFNYLTLNLVKGRIVNGILVHEKEGAGVFWFGPYILLPQGRYLATFWLRLNEPFTGHAITLDVAKDKGRVLLNKVRIMGDDFADIGKWKKFELPFELKEDAYDVELRGIYVADGVNLCLAKIELSKLK